MLLQAAPRVARADSATIFLMEESDGGLRVAARVGFASESSAGPRRRGLTQHVLASGEPLLVEDTTADPRVHPNVVAAGTRSFVALPLLVRRPTSRAGRPPSSPTPPEEAPAMETHPIGVLYVNSRRPHGFDAPSVETLKGLAALAAVAIENVQLLASQRSTAERLSEALEAREQFASAASHELKTPLTPLKGYAQAISRRVERAATETVPVDSAWLQRAVTVMLDQIDRMDRLVTDLLDASRLRTGRFTIFPEPLDAVAVARAVFERFRNLAMSEAESGQGAGVHTLHWHAGAESLPGRWDKNRLDQLLTNLLSNATKYSPAGGDVDVVVEPADPRNPQLREHAPEIGPGWVHFAVRDEGIGLPDDPAAREALFHAYTRGPNIPAERFSGFGLGLYICAEIVRRHGGAIWGESAGAGRGSTFHVLLPPEPPAPSDAADGAFEEAAEARGSA